MNRALKKESIPIVKKVLDEVDVYHFTNFPWQASLQDVRGHNDKILRPTIFNEKLFIVKNNAIIKLY